MDFSEDHDQKLDFLDQNFLALEFAKFRNLKIWFSETSLLHPVDPIDHHC
jgi:hypothetical protein